MANRFNPTPRKDLRRGFLGSSAKWLASKGRLLIAGFSNQVEQERTLECLQTLGVGLEVRDTDGRQLYSNRTNGTLRDGVTSLSRTRQLIDVAQSPDDTWRTQNTRSNPSDSPTRREGIQIYDESSPRLQELPGNRWIQVFGTRSAVGRLAIARVDVTDMVRRGQDLEDRILQLMRDSATDGLTGLANRRQFDHVFAAEWNRATRSHTPISLLMVDIDHFKKYNDHYGHRAGDQCLQRVASALEGCVRRAGELVARYGGEEFVLLLPGADQAEACETAQKCLDRIQDAALVHAASPNGNRVTLSIGVASLQPRSAFESVAILNAADTAMYRAKSGGRARYEVAGEADWTISDDTPRTQPGAL